MIMRCKITKKTCFDGIFLKSLKPLKNFSVACN